MTVVAYEPRLSAVVGNDAMLVLFLSQVLYWHGAGKNGEPRYGIYDQHGGCWLAKSSKEWEHDTLLSRRQVDRCIQTLEAMKLMESRLMRFKGSPTKHIRFAFLQGRREIVTIDRLLALATIGKLGKLPQPKSTDHCTKTPNPIGEKVQSNTDTSAHSGSDECIQIDAPSIGVETMVTKLHNSSAQILAAYQASKSAGIPTEKVTPQGMYEVWRQAVPTYTEGVSYVAPFTMKQMGLVKHLIKLWGKDSPKVLLGVIKGWVAFTKYCEANTTAFKSPLQPSLPYLVTHGQAAVNWYMSEGVPKLQSTAKTPLKLGVIVKKPVDTGGIKQHNTLPAAQTPVKLSGKVHVSKAALPVAQDDEDAPITLAELLAYKPGAKPVKGG